MSFTFETTETNWVCMIVFLCAHVRISISTYTLTSIVIMRPSSLGGGRILRRTLSVCLSVRPSRYRYRASRRAT